MTGLPLENLELQALEERKHLQERAAELKARLEAARDKLDPKNNVREHFMGLAIIAGALGLLSGYTAAGLVVHG